MTIKNESLILSMVDELRMIYKSDHRRAEPLIETYLNERLKDYFPRDRIAMLEEIAHQFERSSLSTESRIRPESNELKQIYSLLFGNKIVVGDLSADEINNKLTESINTVFDTVNQIIHVIHETLLGDKGELQTIREVIGSQLESEGSHDSLNSYLNQIQEAFLISHRAFQEAARTNIKQLLNELDPDRISETMDGIVKFGPLYKAKLYEAYEKRHRECRTWSESNRFTQDLLREFEKTCLKSYMTNTGNSS
jgi:hypothetical protein